MGNGEILDAGDLVARGFLFFTRRIPVIPRIIPGFYWGTTSGDWSISRVFQNQDNVQYPHDTIPLI